MLIEAFKAEEFYDLLGKRRLGFLTAIAHLDKRSALRNKGRGLIVETGCVRTIGNWEGDGQSTLIWDWVCRNDFYDAMTVDLDPAATKVAAENTTKVLIKTSDSVKFLNDLNPETIAKIDLLYLDSYDWAPGVQHLESSFHHMAELAAVWSHLPSGCMIMVDDRHDDVQGKHFMVARFMAQLDVPPVYVGYQIAWVKP